MRLYIPYKSFQGERGRKKKKNNKPLPLQDNIYLRRETAYSKIPTVQIITQHTQRESLSLPNVSRRRQEKKNSTFFTPASSSSSSSLLLSFTIHQSRLYYKVSHPPVLKSGSSRLAIMVGIWCCSQAVLKNASYRFWFKNSWRLRLENCIIKEGKATELVKKIRKLSRIFKYRWDEP